LGGGTASSFSVYDAFGGGSLVGTVNASGYRLYFSAEAEQEHDLALRLAGHALVAFMPPMGLSEVLETLSDYYEFHSSVPPQIGEGGSTQLLIGDVVSHRVATAPEIDPAD